MLPPRDQLTICFAHVAYRFGERFPVRSTGIAHVEVRNREQLDAAIADADVLVVSGLWRNELIGTAKRLRFIQSISAGVDQYDKDALRAAGIRLTSAAGVNARAVSDHAMALILATSRLLPDAVRNQARQHWRGMIGNLSKREDELGGKTLLVIGLGRIGGRLGRLARAFDMRVIGVRRDPSAGGDADAVHALADLPSLLPQADYVALTCPLTPETERLMNAETLALMKPRAQLVNVSRGKVVDEAALVAALRAGTLAGAALDCTEVEPLPAGSPLWDMPNVLITPHTGGETRRYEDGVIDFLMQNLERLWRGEAALVNQIV